MAELREPVRKWSPVPREHGAWGILAQPFVGALLVLAAKREGSPSHWLTAIPAAIAVAVAFLIREPLLVLARQRWVWRGPERPETAPARKWAAIELGLGIAAALTVMWPVRLLIALGAAAAAVTAVAIYITLRNRQRAIWFQGLSAVGLSASGLVACLTVTGEIPSWGWWWWGLHAAHFFAGILVVHVRLEARIAARKSCPAPEEFPKLRRDTAAIEALFAGAGAAMLATGFVWYGAAALLSAAWHFYNLYAARTPAAVAMPMTSVGQRALAASIIFTLLTAAGAVAGG